MRLSFKLIIPSTPRNLRANEKSHAEIAEYTEKIRKRTILKIRAICAQTKNLTQKSQTIRRKFVKEPILKIRAICVK